MAKKTAKLALVNRNEIRSDDIDSYITEDNIGLRARFDSVFNDIDAHRIQSVFAFKSARVQDEWLNRNVNRLVSEVFSISRSIRRLEMLARPHSEPVTAVGSTGTTAGDFDQLLELVANASYAIGVLQGAKLEGASDARLKQIWNAARL